MEMEIGNGKTEQGHPDVWDQFKFLLNHKEVSRMIGLLAFSFKWKHLIESLVTKSVIEGLIFAFYFLYSSGVINQTSFGFKFGTIFD
jgi:hypothetical protein